jgi:hypothetical protein
MRFSRTRLASAHSPRPSRHSPPGSWYSLERSTVALSMLVSPEGHSPVALLSLLRAAAGPSLACGYVVRQLQSVLCPAPTPSGWRTPPCPGGPLQFRARLSLRSTSLTPGGSWWVLSRSGLPHVHGLRPCLQGSAPPWPPRSRRKVSLTARQTSRHAADHRFARPPYEDFVSGLRRRPYDRRRRSATRRLDPYRDRTPTGKSNTAYLDAPGRRDACAPRGGATLQKWHAIPSPPTR